MILSYHLFHQNKIAQKGKTILKAFLHLCVIIIVLSGIAIAADRDVIIGFHKPVGPSEKDIIHGHGGKVKKEFRLINAASARVPENEIEKLKKNPKVAYIENDSIFQAADEYTSSWGVQRIGSQIVHSQGINGTGVKIAVLDTGIDYNHVDLDGNYRGGYDFVFNDTDPFDDSTYSHGTHVAGIIAAENNGIGVVGVAPNADIYAVKVLDGGGSGLASWIIAGIEWAVNNNMSIVTMSLQGPDDNIALHNAVDNAYNSGLLLIAAGGNTYGGSVQYPAAYDSVIAVTATNDSDQRASFSSIGPEIELAAPGVNIYSTIRGGYGYLNGTSMAAPHVTGVAALILSSNFQDVNGDGIRNNTDVRELLHKAKDLGDAGKDIIYGYGLVDAPQAVLGIVESVIELTLTRTKGSPNGDAKRVSLWEGNYSITIRNSNLSGLSVEIYENGVIRKNLSSKYKFHKSDEIIFYLDVKSTFDVVFIPQGRQTSTGYVTIRRLQ